MLQGKFDLGAESFKNISKKMIINKYNKREILLIIRVAK